MLQSNISDIVILELLDMDWPFNLPIFKNLTTLKVLQDTSSHWVIKLLIELCSKLLTVSKDLSLAFDLR